MSHPPHLIIFRLLNFMLFAAKVKILISRLRIFTSKGTRTQAQSHALIREGPRALRYL